MLAFTKKQKNSLRAKMLSEGFGDVRLIFDRAPDGTVTAGVSGRFKGHEYESTVASSADEDPRIFERKLSLIESSIRKPT
jgi:hypothetical protein